MADRVVELTTCAQLLHNVHAVIVLKHTLQPRDVQAAAQRTHDLDLTLDVGLVRLQLCIVRLYCSWALGDCLARKAARRALVHDGHDHTVGTAADLVLNIVEVVQVPREAVVGVACGGVMRLATDWCVSVVPDVDMDCSV